MSNYLKNIVLLAITAIAGVSLAACTDSFDQEQKQAVVQQITVPKDNAQKQKLYDYLLGEQGIDIIKIGETRTIVIASDSLFVPGSANFNPGYAQFLKIVGRLINSYDTTSVSIFAYTDKEGDAARALTERQAQKVFSSLEKTGINTRLIYAKGYGNSNPVSIKNHSVNRRVEIKFQFHPQKAGSL